MSLSTSIYLGPYFLCTTSQSTYTITDKTCTDRTCKARDLRAKLDATHCSLCGNLLQERTSEYGRDRVRTEQVAEDLRNQLMYLESPTVPVATGQHLWLPNARRPGQPRMFRVQEPDGLVLDLGEPCQHAEAHWLLKAFRAEHLILQKHYVEANVAVRWGLLVWRW
jgi:hypothetical protein